jgi:hypothetical protein
LLHQVGDLFQLNVKLRCQKFNVFPVVTNEIFGTSKVSKDAELRNIHSLFYAPFFLHNSWNSDKYFDDLSVHANIGA